MDVVGIFGPTASGKSAAASLLAARLETQVVSADALQVYRGLEILTNQPSEPTLLVGVRTLDETMTVGEYAELAHEAIDTLCRRHGAAVVAGGTGLYFRAALADLQIPPPVAPEIRRRWQAAYDSDAAATYAELVRREPRAAELVHPNDRRRVVRALELAGVGAPLVPSLDRLWSGRTRRPTLIVGLDVPADELERRIAERTDRMLARGAVEEATSALGSPISITARKALGLHELTSMPREEARERVIVRTRQYAAYQRKWMRRIPGIVLVDGTRPTEQVVDAILDVARAR